jgi:hypothetical protein
MGTAKGNRLRPEEHTTGGPVVRQASRTGQPMTPAGVAASPRWRPRRDGVAEPRGQGVAAGSRAKSAPADPGDQGGSVGPFGINERASRPGPRGPLMSPGFWLHHAAPAWRQVFDRRLRPLNLTPTQFMLLASAGWLAATSGRPPTQQEVADHADADRAMTSRVLQTLVDRGLVIRQPDPADGRVKCLGPTPEDVNLPGAASASRPTSTRRCSAPAAIRCARPSRTSRPGPEPLPDPYGTRVRNSDISACPQRDSNPCRRLERAVS